MGEVVKLGAYAVAFAFIVKNINIISLIVAMIGSFMYMCGLTSGGKVIRFSVVALFICKAFAGVI